MAIAAASATAALPAVALAAPTAPHTALTVDLGDHSPTLVNRSVVYDGETSAVTVTPSAGERLTIRAEAAGSYVSIVVAPPVGQQWMGDGELYGVTRTGDGTFAQFEMTSDGRSCDGAGSLQVDEVYHAAEGVLSSFAAFYQYSCPGDFGLMSGEIRYQSELGYIAAIAEPGVVDFGAQEANADSPTRTVTFRSAGSDPMDFGRATIGEPTRAAFSVVGSTCQDRTLAPGETCTVTVRSHPTEVGQQLAPLLVATDRGAGRVRLSVDGFVGGVIGTYYPLAPQRLMDTRSGLGAPKAKIGAGQRVDLQVTGRGGVPASGVGSVVLNTTVTGPTANSYLTAYPAGESRPTASSINFAPGWLGSNNVTVKVGAGGKVSIYNHAGSTDVVVDVVGFYAADNALKASLGTGGQYHPLAPTRLLDTRKTGGAVPAGQVRQTWVSFDAQADPRVRAVVLNITAVAPTKAGFLSAWSGTGPVPVSSTVNYGAGKVVPNLAIVPTRVCADCVSGRTVPAFSVYTSQTTHIVIDIVGVIDDATLADGLRFKPMSPTRLVDSRIGSGFLGPLPAGETRAITAWRSMVTDITEALAMNVTAVVPTADTVVTVWPADVGLEKPTASNLNPAAGQIVSNAVISGIGPQDRFNMHNLSGSTHLVSDVVGTFYRYLGTASTGTAGAALAGERGLSVVASGVAAPARA
ncbi:hypothetical protein C1I99_07595 [Micromonospora deserti]|uniref:Choice-of-anchor D domain-containing protein n=1 Tax=Micromonospora deserti TaxID=2070366 RepID=A0A2W2DBN6_9ACTN|nr:hypothetical protein C1I99_07595 [Micromonospora deserti]